MSEQAQNPWFKRKLKGIITPSREKKETPDGFWHKTPSGDVIEKTDQIYVRNILKGYPELEKVFNLKEYDKVMLDGNEYTFKNYSISRDSKHQLPETGLIMFKPKAKGQLLRDVMVPKVFLVATDSSLPAKQRFKTISLTEFLQKTDLIDEPFDIQKLSKPPEFKKSIVGQMKSLFGYDQGGLTTSLRPFTREDSIKESNNIDYIESILNNKSYSVFNFKKSGESESPITDDEYIEYVKKAKDHCKRGDVFQLVLSRRFKQKFSGDEFNVYRALRSINPSPYLFFFDYGDFKIFGSSPEAQIVIKDGKSEIHPIAGTFKRTGNDEEDQKTAKELAEDPKENSEHIMLVDLARNDLSRSGYNVKIEKNREVQFYSHVIHLVSKVTSILKDNIKPFQVVEDTFPAGTLSGAPKHRALELIEKYEKVNRNFYGGAIGYIDFNGNFNHAIIIRSFFSKNNILNYQAGAGIVIDSIPEKELEEVKNKLGALDKALEEAEKIK